MFKFIIKTNFAIDRRETIQGGPKPLVGSVHVRASLSFYVKT